MNEILGKELNMQDVAKSYAGNFGDVLGAWIDFN